jgi:hypothetical protein
MYPVRATYASVFAWIVIWWRVTTGSSSVKLRVIPGAASCAWHGIEVESAKAKGAASAKKQRLREILFIRPLFRREFPRMRDFDATDCFAESPQMKRIQKDCDFGNFF